MESFRMNNITICKKCGEITTEEEYRKEVKHFKKANECEKCHSIDMGEIIDIDADNLKELYQNRVKEKYGDKFDNFPFPLSRYIHYQEELIREDYYYGKLDSKKDYSAFKKREQFDKDYLDGKILESNHQINLQTSNTPKCPTCGSTNIRKISTGERMVSVGMLGLFSKKISKSFKCNSCGYTW